MNKNPITRFVCYKGFFIFGLIVFSCLLTQAETGGAVSKSFAVGPGGLLTVDTQVGSIQVRSWDQHEVSIEVISDGKRGPSGEPLDFDVQFLQDGNNVKVTGKILKTESFLSRIFGKSPKVDYQITVPNRYNIDLKTSGGSIRVDDLTGKVRSHTSGGKLTFGRINGPVWGRTSGGSITLISCQGKVDVQTSGGSIKIGEVEGEVIAHTSGGSIEIEKARGIVNTKTSGGSIAIEEAFGAIQARTSAGSIKARFSGQPQADSELSTSAGSVTVTLAEGVAVTVDANTRAGKVSADIPVANANQVSRTSLYADIGGGGPKLVLRTSAGSIYLRR